MNSSTQAEPEKSFSILVVDDEEPIRDVVSWMLEDAGHDVHSAAGGMEALQFLDDNGPVDLLISDINMPGIDGLELVARARRRWPGLPVLLVSGRPPPGGARQFIPKPFRWDTLAQAIAVLAGSDWQEQPGTD